MDRCQHQPMVFILIGGIGMVHNVFVAGVKRKPSASRINIELAESISRQKGMD
ncbi:hypothetical protein K438DRAFT_505418 [Mycena galopus ATCC 62051]|nr:hypothetical protein K438DRAFT_505418 [Mycena galopus ATCC 62051]